MRVLTDFHHSSLLTSLNMLFEDRLGMQVYRPIGMDWFDEGYWAINNQRDTAEQFLAIESQPLDNTPPLNEVDPGLVPETYNVKDPGGGSLHRACTLDYFKRYKFDYVIASIPAHVDVFKKLIKLYQPEAKLIIQLGNNWNIDSYHNENLLASVAPQPTRGNAVFYHQEFDLTIFNDTPVKPTHKIHSYVNVIEHSGVGWEDFKQLKSVLPAYDFRAYGGQCPDGNMTGPLELAESMREAQFIFHVKPGGDGFGHIIHNAYAMGRPILTRPSHYRGQLAEQLLVPGTFIDLDRYSLGEVKNIIIRLSLDTDALEQMGRKAAERFKQVVNYDNEAKEIAQWLNAL